MDKQQRIVELEAQVEILRGAAKYTDEQFRIQSHLSSTSMTVLSQALAKTEHQCLEIVEVAAVKDFLKYIQYDDYDGLINEEAMIESVDFWVKSTKGDQNGT